ncbi:hypothetical protein VP01_3773g1 [Puccinia sorghi]|uniref:Uncharacterized protein n=1 Tax=Puccinia sorghi TaxID=27349 RepID=A0A0L6UTP0_9BASI|nr:hypothetical protein VP01_3773g1 [Puccinia sorghi]
MLPSADPNQLNLALAGGDCKGVTAGSSVIPKRPQRYASPPKYTSVTAKKIAKAKRKLAREHSAIPAHLIIISPSIEPISTKPLIQLPQHGNLSRNCILTQGQNPQFILDVHSFSTPPTPTFVTLSQIISDLYQMALNRLDNKTNTNLLGGSMRGIGFCQGSDAGKSGDLKPTMILLLNGYAHSPTALGMATTKLQRNPNWHQKTWRAFKDDNNFAGNTMVILTLGHMLSFPIFKIPLDFPSLPLPMTLATVWFLPDTMPSFVRFSAQDGEEMKEGLS